MWSVIASALVARRGQTAVLLVVAVLASAAIAAAPWYAVAATRDVAADAITASPVADRLVTVSYRVAPEEPHPDDLAETVRAVLDLPGSATVSGAHGSARFAGEPVPGERRDEDADPAAWSLTYRDDVCSQLMITGQCPSEAGDVLLPTGLAELLGIAVGDEIEIEESQGTVRAATVVGSYGVRDITDPYWGTGEVLRGGGTGRQTVFTTENLVREFDRPTYTTELVVQPAALASMDIDQVVAVINAGIVELRAQDFAVVALGLADVGDRVVAERRQVVLGLGVGVAALLLLTWFALTVMLRGAATQLRADVGWWRLHGAPSGRGWVAALGQCTAPLLAGALLGTLAGLAVGGTLGDAVVGDPEWEQAFWLGLALVGVTVAGGLVVVVATQAGTLRTPVRDLLRRVPARERRWQRSIVDLLVVLVAAVAVAQAMLAGGPESAEGLALLAPPLVVLAVALVAAWAVPPLAAAVATRALHAGRLATTLIAMSMARRPGTHRVFALVAVAVALVTAGFLGWDADARTHQQRAELSVGAPRVLTVEAADPAALLAAVRQVDPDGTAAMAVIRRPRSPGFPNVVTLDSTRLGVVAGWREEYGGDVAHVAGLLRPDPPAPVLITGDRLRVEAATTAGSGPAELTVALRTVDTGEPVVAEFGPLAAEPGSREAPVPECAPAGCRLVGFELPDPEPGRTVALADLAQAGGAGPDPDRWRPVAAEALADPSRWRRDTDPLALCPAVTASDAGINLTVPADAVGAAQSAPAETCAAYLVDSPVPVPVLAAGWRPAVTGDGLLPALAPTPAPATVAGTASLAPGISTPAVLADLEYAQRLAPGADMSGNIAEVWLAPDPPASIVDELAAAGVPTVQEATLAGEVAALRGEAAAVSGRFQTMLALVGLLLAAGAVLVFSGQERNGRARELAVLRAQGVSARLVRRAGYGGLAAVTVAAVLAGGLAGAAGAAVARLLRPGFVDGWDVLPAASPRPAAAAAALAVAGVALGAAVLATAVPLVRRALARPRTDGGE